MDRQGTWMYTIVEVYDCVSGKSSNSPHCLHSLSLSRDALSSVQEREHVYMSREAFCIFRLFFLLLNNGVHFITIFIRRPNIIIWLKKKK